MGWKVRRGVRAHNGGRGREVRSGGGARQKQGWVRSCLSKALSIAHLAGTMVYQLGGGGSGAPWSLNAVIANARTMNPMNALILFNMLSGLFT